MVADVDNDRDKVTTGCEKPKTSAFSLISTEPRVSAAKAAASRASARPPRGCRLDDHLGRSNLLREPLRHLRRLKQPIKVSPQSFQRFLVLPDLVAGLGRTIFAVSVV